METLSVALIGCGKRARNTYAPILKQMQALVKLTAVYNRSEPAARELGEREQVPYYTSLDELIAKEKPDIAIVTTSRDSHKEPVLKLIEAGIHILLETPVTEDLADADAIIAAVATQPVKIEVAEQFYRYPRELIINKLIAANLFGKVNTVYSNFVGHGYHGAALIRSYFGFSTQPVKVTGFSKTFDVVNHIWRVGEPPRDTEKWQHGIIEFDNGSIGVFSFSSLTYGSPLRQERPKNVVSFYAQKGMGVGHDVIFLQGEDQRVNIPIERRTMIKGGMEILDAYVAKNGSEISWSNPLSNYLLDENQIPIALCLYELLNAIKDNREPEYGLVNGRIDRAIEIALNNPLPTTM